MSNRGNINIDGRLYALEALAVSTDQPHPTAKAAILSLLMNPSGQEELKRAALLSKVEFGKLMQALRSLHDVETSKITSITNSANLSGIENGSRSSSSDLRIRLLKAVLGISDTPGQAEV